MLYTSQWHNQEHLNCGTVYRTNSATVQQAECEKKKGGSWGTYGLRDLGDIRVNSMDGTYLDLDLQTRSKKVYNP